MIAAVVFATSVVGRPLADALRARGQLSIVVGSAVVVSFAFVLARAGTLRPWWATSAFALSWIVAALSWPLPEERLHLALFGALGASLGPSPRRWVFTSALLLGPADEALQALLPDRRFDPFDVVADGCATLSAWAFLRGELSRTRAFLPLCVVASVQLSRAPVPPTFPVLPTPAEGRHSPLPSETRAGPEPAIVLITLDAVRADALRGEGPPALPTLLQLRKESIAAERAIANAAWTSPSVVTLLTGLHPAVHGVQARGLSIQPGLLLPLEQLAAQGVTVLGFAGDGDENYDDIGISRVFDRKQPLEQWLSAHLPRVQPPLFLWIHLRDVHAPYDLGGDDLRAYGLDPAVPTGVGAEVLDRARRSPTVPRAMFPGDHRWLRDPLRRLYLGEVARLDATLGRVLRVLRSQAWWENATLAITADHGEELLEHGGVGHASTNLDTRPWDEVVSIPLWVRLPGARGGGAVLPGISAQVDVLPTLLDLAGLRVAPPGAGWDGWSLASPLQALTRGDAVAARARSVLHSSSPCGWQCPPERRAERVHALFTGEQVLSCAVDEPCPEPLRAALDAADARRAAARSPVALPLR